MGFKNVVIKYYMQWRSSNRYYVFLTIHVFYVVRSMMRLKFSGDIFVVHMVQVEFKFLHNISHYYNNIFAFHMHVFTIHVLSLNKFNITIHSNIKFMVIAYN